MSMPVEAIMAVLCKLRVSNSLVTKTLPCLTCAFSFLGSWFRAIAQEPRLGNRLCQMWWVNTDIAKLLKATNRLKDFYSRTTRLWMCLLAVSDAYLIDFQQLQTGSLHALVTQTRFEEEFCPKHGLVPKIFYTKVPPMSW